MPHVSLKHKNESFESLFRRWKKSVEKAETLKTLHEREFYTPPGEKRKRAKAAAVKRQQRIQFELDCARKGITIVRSKKSNKKNRYSDNESDSSY